MSIKKRENRDDAIEAGKPGEPFLRRWTRRKADAATSSEAREFGRDDHEPPIPADREKENPGTNRATGGEVAGIEEAGNDEHKGDEDMPPLDSIDRGGSVAEFFSPGVSQGLRRAALRRLFAQSKLPVGDDLDDYAGDYTKFTKLGDLVTNEMRHRLEIIRQRLARRVEEEERLARADSASDSVTPQAERKDRAEIDETPPDADGDDDQEFSEHDRNRNLD